MTTYVIEKAPAEVLGPEFEHYRVAVIHSIPPDDDTLILVDPDRCQQQ